MESDLDIPQEAPRKERVLIVDDEASAREGLFELVSSWGYETRSSENGRKALEEISRFNPGIVITDLAMPDMDGIGLIKALREKGVLDYMTVVVLTARGTIETAVETIKGGAYDFLTKPVDIVRLRHLLGMAADRNKIYREVRELKTKVRKLGTFKNLNGSTPAMKAVFKQIELAAPSSASVLISGESGTGKELVARAIFEMSRRNTKAFVAMNCAAIPATLLESELFGHEKGAFTGAISSKEGCFEVADQGTIFLDEIGEMALDTQTKLLRVLETGTFRRVGGVEEKKVDVRVIAATNKICEEAIEDGHLREDLYYRLNVFNIKVPPLRERIEDIPLLVQSFIDEFNLKNDRNVKGLSTETMKLLKRYSWPGNVRELKNAIERAVIVCRGELIKDEDLPEVITHRAAKAPSLTLPIGSTLDEVEKQFLFATIDYHGGNKTKAAEALNISLKTLHNKLNRYKSSI